MFDIESDLKTDLERAMYLQNILIARSTGESSDDAEYKCFRNYFVNHSEYRGLVPDFVRTKRDLHQFWNFIKHKFGRYTDRRKFIWDKFTSLLNHIEKIDNNSISKSLSDKQLSDYGVNAIHYEIQKGLNRIKDDPEGAITIARTIMESTCKFIAYKRKISYTNNTALSELYRDVSKELNLSPDQHTEKIFKQILGGCSGIVNGLGLLRNKLGDAHGKGANRIKPAPRHAELAVNLAGSMAIFLIETHNSRNIDT